MRAEGSASTVILVAAWEQSLHPGGPGHRLAYRKGPLNAENAVRTTGLLTAGRNPGRFFAWLSTTITGGIADTCALWRGGGKGIVIPDTPGEKESGIGERKCWISGRFR